MLGFFRINDPYRLIFILILILVFRLPFILSGIPLSVQELNWMLVGEAMANGKMMYRDIWEHMGPLAAFFYQLTNHAFGKSQTAYQLISIGFVFFQAIIFNRLLLINKAYNENSYVPALVYILCMSCCFELLTLSPALISITFVLLAINNIFKRIDNFTQDDLFLNTGIYLGVATLFHLPSALFFLSTLLSLVLFTSTIMRRLVLMTFGFVLAQAIATTYYFWFDSGREFYFQFFRAPFGMGLQPLLGAKSLLLVSLVVIVFFLLSVFKLYSKRYYVNFQVKFQSVMLIMIVAALLSLLLVPRLSAVHLVVIAPFVAFFLSHYFLLIENRLKAEIIFIVFVAAMFGYQQVVDRQLRWLGQLVDFSPLEVKKSASQSWLDGKSILVLGEDISMYQNSSLATPYLNWRLAQQHFQNMEYYDVIVEVFENFENDLPQVIVDEEDKARQIFEKMPGVAMKYRKAAGERTYILK